MFLVIIHAISSSKQNKIIPVHIKLRHNILWGWREIIWIIDVEYTSFVGSSIVFSENKYRHNCEKRCRSDNHKQRKTLLKDHVVRFKIISLYIYKDLRPKT